MFGSIDPRKLQSMMKQMGIAQETIDATRVIIETPDKKIIIDNPSVAKVKMQGNESFQISGDVSEENLKNNEEEIDESAQIEEDLETITSQTGVSKEIAAIELEKNNGDIAETIISLKKKK